MSEKNNLISGVLIIISFLLGMYADKFLNQPDYGTLDKTVSAKAFNPEVQKALSHNGQSPEVVFAVTRNGSIQAFVPEGAKVFKPKFPLHAGNIVNINTVTVFATSNPKVCWVDTNGYEECVNY